jgi:sirohydrochlorin ferrochelatase
MPADLPPSGCADRWPWLQQLRSQPELDAEPWLAALEAGVLRADQDLLAVLAERLDPPAQLRLLRWWRQQPDPDPGLPSQVLRHRDGASAAWLLEQLAPGPVALGFALPLSALPLSALPQVVAAALLPLLGHQRQVAAWPVLLCWMRAPIATPLRRAALEGVARGLSVWPRSQLVAGLSALAGDLDPQLAAPAVDLLARLPGARRALVPLRRCGLDPRVAERLGRRLAATPAQPLLLVVHGRAGGQLPAELVALAAELECRRGAPVRLQALSAAAPPAAVPAVASELLQPGQVLGLVPLLLLPGGHVRHDLPAIVRHWSAFARVQRWPFLGAWPRWQAALARELAGLATQDARPLLLHHPLEGPLAARYLTTLERRTGAHCVATPYSAEHLAELKLTLAAPALAAPALAAPALPLALAANRLTDQLAEQVGPPLLQRPGLRQLLLAELEALP